MTMEAAKKDYIVTAPYEVAYPNPIKLLAGDKVTITKRETNPDWLGWVFCISETGIGGWVSETYLDVSGTSAKVIRNYDATELAVTKDELVHSSYEEFGWAWVCNRNGKEGWVPLKNLEATAEIILIGDDRVKNISVKECGDPIIDILIHFPDLKFDLERKHVQKESVSISMARKTVAQMLIKAQSYLPVGIQILVKECYRPMSVQKKFWDGYSAYLRKQNPSWSEERIYNECSKLNAPLDVAPHTTGGAVDLTLVNDQGQWLDMGTEFNASPHETNGATYTNAQNISEDAKSNRLILTKAMTRAGFVNYPTEWWHWSYGDKYWAVLTGAPAAIFQSKEVT